MIEKSKENNGFQGWHRDFYLRTEVTMTIVRNVGAVMKNETFLSRMRLANSFTKVIRQPPT